MQYFSTGEILKDKSFVYTGQENLEAMKFAKNYNNYLSAIVKKQIEQSHADDIAILDFGAGIGTYADMISGPRAKVECLEIDKNQLETLKSNGYESYDSIDSIKKKYDLIYSFNVFEHIDNDKEVFEMLTDLLKPGGRIIVYVPAFKVLFSSMDRLVGHLRRYKKTDLINFISGMPTNKIVEVSYRDPLGFFVTLAFKFIGNKDGLISGNSVGLYDKFIFPVSRILETITNRWLGKNALLIVECRKK